MNRAALTEKILDIKRQKGWSWKHICQEIGGYSPVLLVGELFGLSAAETALLNEVPMRGAGVPMPPTDPLIYRFYELVMVNGPAWKALIEEEFGDGIMSAIDFDLAIERLPNPKATASRSPCRASSCRTNTMAIPAISRNTATR